MSYIVDICNDKNESIQNKSLWEMIFEELKKNEIDVYPPATHEGKCKKPYVVLKQDGGNQLESFSSERIFFMFMLYVPRSKYSYLDEFEKMVKNVLENKLYPMIMPTGSEESDYYDDNYDAHMRSFTYRANKRNKHL